MTREEALEYINNMYMYEDTKNALETLIPEFGKTGSDKVIDHEDKYKEALLEARAVLEPCLKYSNGKVREALDSIDKELKSFESEDERMLRTIIRGFENLKGNGVETFNNTKIDDILAYLENQKPSFKQIHDSVMWDSGLRPGIELGKQKEQKQKCGEKGMNGPQEIGDWRGDEGVCKKQKEQNGEDEECTDFTIYYPHKNGKGEYECIPYSFYDSLTFFSEDKDLIDFHRTCFYTEEECNEWIEQHKEEEGYEAIPVESTLEYKLGFKAGKESEKQKEQKPVSISCGHENDAEWTDEDEMRLNHLITFVEKYGLQFYASTNKVIEWLKSRRPQYHGDVTMTEAYKMGKEAGEASRWKPSEEQMNKLKEVIYGLCTCGNGPVLKSLYEDLKKLI